ncbi:MAG TPA: type VI secretion system baseplate subunit TssK [Candidatus Acidoferrum sp.]|nr:type VI secretion system baseplate subunit TssK [Candidatus Acidoferrum sp.]
MHVHWQEGLFLQPHHLQIMQRRLQADIRAARALLTPYCYGVVECRLSNDDLADGRIRLERLSAIMPSGQEISFPDDTSLPSLDIKTELARGAASLMVLLAVPLWVKKRANSFRQDERPDPRVKLLYIPEESRETADENTGDNPQVIHVRKINARILLKGEDISDMESLPLLRILRSTGAESGKPQLDPEFVPPSLLLRSSPVLHEMVRELVAQLNASRNDLRMKVATGGHGLEMKWELTMKLGTLNRACASLPEAVEAGVVTPFALHLRLRELLGELLALFPQKTTFECEPYNHDDPLRSFKELDQKIRDLIPVTKGIPPKTVAFGGSPGLMRAILEAEDFQRPTGYFLGVITRADRTKLAVYLSDPDKFKLMPRSNEQVAIRGLELKEESFPPLDLPSQSNLHYFRLVPSSNQRRWDQIKQDLAMSLVWNNSQFDLSDAKFTLFMTLPPPTT